MIYKIACPRTRGTITLSALSPISVLLLVGGLDDVGGGTPLAQVLAVFAQTGSGWRPWFSLVGKSWDVKLKPGGPKKAGSRWVLCMCMGRWRWDEITAGVHGVVAYGKGGVCLYIMGGTVLFVYMIFFCLRLQEYKDNLDYP